MRNTRLTFLHMLSGVVIAVLLGIHMVISHLDNILGSATVPTAWESMIGRSEQGIWAALYIALLAFGIYHGLYGLRNIILEWTSSVRAGRIISRALLLTGIVVFAWGSYVPLALLTR